VEPQCDISLSDLDADPHPVLARLREHAPACWVPQHGGWLVTGYDAAVTVLAAPDTFTVDDPRFTTARVTGPSMLSRDGAEHARHRAPFSHMLLGNTAGPAQLRERLAEFTAAEARRLADAIGPQGRAELREAVAGPLAAAVMTEALGLHGIGVASATVLAWYRDIVTAVAELPPADPAAGPSADGDQGRVPVASFSRLAEKLRAAMAAGTAPLLAGAAGGHAGEDGGGAGAGAAGTSSGPGALTAGEVVSNAAVMLFGGIETTEGMICNALLHLLGSLDAGQSDTGHRGGSRVTGRSPGAFGAIGVQVVDESLRLEPAAAVVDRYATRDVTVAGAGIRRGDLVTVSLAGANRDPALFPDPDSFNPSRPNAHRHLSFARGPHFCIGAHLARLETLTAVNTLLARLPELRLDGQARVRGLVFRKPPELRVTWQAA
jgi:cytochrome P450